MTHLMRRLMISLILALPMYMVSLTTSPISSVTIAHADSSTKPVKELLKRVEKIQKIKLDLKDDRQIKDALKILKEAKKDTPKLLEASKKVAPESTSSKVKDARKKLTASIKKFQDKLKKAFEKLDRNKESSSKAKDAKSYIKDAQKLTKEISSALKALKKKLEEADKQRGESHKKLMERLNTLAEKVARAGEAKNEKKAKKAIKYVAKVEKLVSKLKAKDQKSEEIKAKWPKAIKKFREAAKHLVFIKQHQTKLKDSIKQCKSYKERLIKAAKEYEAKPGKETKAALDQVAASVQEGARAELASGKELHDDMKSARSRAKFSGPKDWSVVKDKFERSVQTSFKGWKGSYKKLKKACKPLKDAKKHKRVKQANKSSKPKKYQRKLANFTAASERASGCHSIPYPKGVKKCDKLQKKVDKHCKSNSGSCSKLKTFSKVSDIWTYQKKINEGKDVEKSTKLLEEAQEKLEDMMSKVPENLRKTKKCYFARVKVQKHYNAMDEKMTREKNSEIQKLAKVIRKNHVQSEKDHEQAYRQDKLAWKKCEAAKAQKTFPKMGDLDLSEMK